MPARSSSSLISTPGFRISVVVFGRGDSFSFAQFDTAVMSRRTFAGTLAHGGAVRFARREALWTTRSKTEFDYGLDRFLRGTLWDASKDIGSMI